MGPLRSESKPRLSAAWIVFGIMLVHAGMLAYSAKVHSPCIDEVGQVPGGLLIWQHARYDVYAVNPPLMRAVAALPWHLSGAADVPDFLLPQIDRTPGDRPEMAFGIAFCAVAGSRIFDMYFVARLFCIPFSLLGIWASYRLATDLFDSRAGLAAAVLWAFSPMALAFGAVCVPDIATASFGLTFFLFFRRWLLNPSWSAFYVTGLLLGATLLTKFTWLVILALVLPICCLLYTPRPQWFRRLGALAGIGAVGLFILNLGYEFDGSLTRLGAFRFVSRPLCAGEHGGNRFIGTPLEYVPVPLPKQYVLGIDMQKRDFELGMRSYMAGMWKEGGWHSYYLYGTLIKTPLPYFVMTLLTLYAMRRPSGRLAWRDELFLLLPAVAVFGFVSSQNGFSHHLRYVFPAFPFWFVAISRIAGPAFAGGTVRRWRLDTCCLVWAVAVGVLSFPHNMWYFNEFVGGSARGDEHMLDSNSDWGQDLLYLRDWLDEHPEVEDLSLACFSLIDPRSLGIEYRLPPSGLYRPEMDAPRKSPSLERVVEEWFVGHQSDGGSPQPLDPRVGGGPRPGYFVIGAEFLRGAHFPMADGAGGIFASGDAHFTYFQNLTPIGRAGYSFRIYHISPEQAKELRRELGWPVNE